MRIGFDAKRAFHNTTGLGNYSRDLIRVLALKHPDNQYFLYNTKPKKVDRLPKQNNLIEVLPNSKFWKKFSSIWRQKKIVDQFKENSIEVYHGLSGEIPIGVYKSIKTVVTIHDLIFIRYPELYSFFDRKIYYYKFKYAAKNADKIIAISEQTKKDIIKFLKVDASKIEVIYQGCHSVFKEIASLEEKKQLKQKYNLPQEFVLNVGTIEARKNVLSAIKAIKNLSTEMVIVGKKTEYFEEVTAYIKDNSLEKRIHFLEGVSLKDLSTLYQCATVFVYPSIFEGFGIPIIEALYAKTPVITSTGSCFSEAGGPNSIYVNPSDVVGLSNKIKIVLEDKVLQEKMATEGFNQAQGFNDNVIADAYLNMYKSLF